MSTGQKIEVFLPFFQPAIFRARQFFEVYLPNKTLGFSKATFWFNPSKKAILWETHPSRTSEKNLHGMNGDPSIFGWFFALSIFRTDTAIFSETPSLHHSIPIRFQSCSIVIFDTEMMISAKITFYRLNQNSLLMKSPRFRW